VFYANFILKNIRPALLWFSRGTSQTVCLPPGALHHPGVEEVTRHSERTSADRHPARGVCVGGGGAVTRGSLN